MRINFSHPRSTPTKGIFSLTLNVYNLSDLLGDRGVQRHTSEISVPFWTFKIDDRPLLARAFPFSADLARFWKSLVLVRVELAKSF